MTCYMQLHGSVSSFLTLACYPPNLQSYLVNLLPLLHVNFINDRCLLRKFHCYWMNLMLLKIIENKRTIHWILLHLSFIHQYLCKLFVLMIPAQQHSRVTKAACLTFLVKLNWNHYVFVMGFHLWSTQNISSMGALANWGKKVDCQTQLLWH